MNLRPLLLATFVGLFTLVSAARAAALTAAQLAQLAANARANPTQAAAIAKAAAAQTPESAALIAAAIAEAVPGAAASIAGAVVEAVPAQAASIAGAVVLSAGDVRVGADQQQSIEQISKAVVSALPLNQRTRSTIAQIVKTIGGATGITSTNVMRRSASAITEIIGGNAQTLLASAQRATVASIPTLPSTTNSQVTDRVSAGGGS